MSAALAIVSHQIGLVFEYQGRFGAAVKSMQDAVKSFRRQGENGLDMAEFLNDLSGALARSGRSDEAAAPLEEAEKIQQALKNDASIGEYFKHPGRSRLLSWGLQEAQLRPMNPRSGSPPGPSTAKCCCYRKLMWPGLLFPRAVSRKRHAGCKPSECQSLHSRPLVIGDPS